MGESTQSTIQTMKSVAVLLLIAIVSVSLANTGFDEEVPEDSLVASSSTATSSSGFLFKAIKKALAEHRRKVCAKRANKCHKHVAKKTAKHAKMAKNLMKATHKHHHAAQQHHGHAHNHMKHAAKHHGHAHNHMKHAAKHHGHAAKHHHAAHSITTTGSIMLIGPTVIT